MPARKDCLLSLNVFFAPAFLCHQLQSCVACLLVRIESTMRLTEIADKLGARLDPPGQDLEITGVAPIESASAGQISFIANSKYAPLAKTTGASALIVDEKFPATAKPLLLHQEPAVCLCTCGRAFLSAPKISAGDSPNGCRRFFGEDWRQRIHRCLCCDW